MLSQKPPYPTPYSPTHPFPLFGPGIPLYWGIYNLHDQWASRFFFKLDIVFIYIANAIPQVSYTYPPLICSPTHPLPVLGLAFPCTGAYKGCKTNVSLFLMMDD